VKGIFPRFCSQSALAVCLLAAVQSSQHPALETVHGQESTTNHGSLYDIASKQRTILMVKRIDVIDARDDAKAALEEALRGDPRVRRGHGLAYNTIAKKLNDYIKDHNSLTAVRERENADFIILFNLLEYRYVLGVFYAYGDLFVISTPHGPNQPPPSVVWRSRKPQFADDAISNFIRDLKRVRGEG
jgi:hypothetical protein